MPCLAPVDVGGCFHCVPCSGRLSNYPARASVKRRCDVQFPQRRPKLAAVVGCLHLKEGCCTAIDGPPCWTATRALAALYAAIDSVPTPVATTRVTLYSCIWQLSLPRAEVSCMAFSVSSVTVNTCTYAMLRWASSPSLNVIFASSSSCNFCSSGETG